MSHSNYIKKQRASIDYIRERYKDRPDVINNVLTSVVSQKQLYNERPF